MGQKDSSSVWLLIIRKLVILWILEFGELVIIP